MAGLEEVIEPSVQSAARSIAATVSQQPVSPKDDGWENWLAKELIELIQRYDLFPYLLVALAIAGLVTLLYLAISKWLGWKKDIAGTQKDVADAAKTMLDNLERVNQIRDKHSSQEDEHNLHLSILVEQVSKQAPAAEIDRAREDAIDHFCQQYLPTLERYLEAYSVTRSRRECRRFLKTSLIKEHETAQKFCKVVNLPVLRQGGARAPLVLKADSLDAIWAFGEKCVRWHHFRLHRALRKARRQWPE
jgi:hypothetical protein